MQQEWWLEAIVGHRFTEAGVLELCAKWRPSLRAVTEQDLGEWEIEKVVPCGDARFELVYWCDTWEPVDSLVDADGTQAEAYANYRLAHPDL
jgi:hypothetical protein